MSRGTRQHQQHQAAPNSNSSTNQMSCDTRPHQAVPGSTTSTREMTRQHQAATGRTRQHLAAQAAPVSSAKQMSHLQAATQMLVVDIPTQQLEEQLYTYPSLK